MRVKYLPAAAKAAWRNNAPFIWLILCLLGILSVLKIIFYYYNYNFIFGDDETANSRSDIFKLIKWSLYNDVVVLLLINAPLLLLLQVCRSLPAYISRYFILPVFVLLNSITLLLNLSDIFYFPFHFQRANTDLVFVLQHPFTQLFHLPVLIILTFIFSIAATVFITWKICLRFLISFSAERYCGISTILAATGILCGILFKDGLGKILLPAYPLSDINSKQLLIVQNSAQTFAYSLFRGGQEVKLKNYMPLAECDSVFPIRKIVAAYSPDSPQKNIVLFIMESVPYDFFDSTSPYKVAMPFFDSLLQKSSFFNNAFCYAHQSNKGITAILAGTPTLSDIPLYHSSFINMPFTPIGLALKRNNYHSFFCIGDEHDNFGFAKCCNWMGIDQYYSKEDIPGYRSLPAHTMGVQDEYVLDFMHKKINEISAPFFAINFNISTHYPYDLPQGFKKNLPSNYSAPMKSMVYYDQSLQQFFNAAKKESWFRNTVFIFCSDHWLVPNDQKVHFNAITGYRIPIIIYDPAMERKEVFTQLASQFDIMGTILSIGGYKDSIVSYGSSLFDRTNASHFVFSRANSALYQVTDSSYILGYNSSNDKPEFLYNYKNDPSLQQNLVADNRSAAKLSELNLKIRAFIQKAALQYNRAAFK
jgi:hypothetical protein